MIITFVDRFFKHHFTITPWSKCDGQCFVNTFDVLRPASDFVAASFDKLFTSSSSSDVYLLFFHINTNFKKKCGVSDRCTSFWDSVVVRGRLSHFLSEQHLEGEEKKKDEISEIRVELTNLNFALHFSSYSYRQSMRDPHSPPPRSGENKVKDRKIIVYKRSSQFEGQQNFNSFRRKKNDGSSASSSFFRSNFRTMSDLNKDEQTKAECRRNRSIQRRLNFLRSLRSWQGRRSFDENRRAGERGRTEGRGRCGDTLW